MENNSTEVFISYAWGGDSEKIVNELDQAFQQKGITLVRDKRDLGFKGMITDFMLKIGTGKAVVVVISDKYMKSPYCMFELLEIYRNQQFKERVFPIVLGDANIFDPLPRLQYLKHWQDKKKELDEAIMQFGTDAITVIGDDYKTHKNIFDNFGEIVNILKDINSLTPQMHRDSEFSILIGAVEKLIGDDNKSATLQSIVKDGVNAEPAKHRIKTDLSQITDFRKKSIYKRLEMLYKLMDDYESKLMLEDDPKRQMAYEKEIEKLKVQIESAENEYNNL